MEVRENDARAAVLDSAHLGDIRGALGTIRHDDIAPRNGWKQRLKTLLAILGPGLIVMVGDNDAGAFSTYTEAGQNYGTSLLWTLALLIPVLYVNQEMVLRLGSVTRVGHARLILERFGRFWGAFSAIDLFVLNALTIVTEFIGISLGMGFLGVPKIVGVLLAAVFIMLSASTGDFRRFERFSLTLVAGSLLLVPILVMIHPPLTQVAHDFVTPQMPHGGKLADVMLIIIGIVGTTVAPWQLFFQQSYVIDKRITPRFIQYQRADLWLGIILVVLGAVAMIAFTAQVFAGHPEFGHFQDAGAVAHGLSKYYGRLPGVLFAIALIDASIIGASAVSLSTAYALGDVLSLKHSLHRKPSDAIGFYLMYCGLILFAAVLVLLPNVPLGLLVNAVQTLAGVLLPSATVFLLLLCNDRDVLGPWVNSRLTNVLTALIVSGLVLMSIILTAAVVFPDISGRVILDILIVGGIASVLVVVAVQVLHAREQAREQGGVKPVKPDLDTLYTWRMPPLAQLKPMVLSGRNKLWMAVLRFYLLLAVGMVIYKVAMSL
jgi:NRAMP (natural resistance-associated macrophage protein)-like metal ion transporter